MMAEVEASRKKKAEIDEEYGDVDGELSNAE
jgi:hypothetical protein